MTNLLQLADQAAATLDAYADPDRPRAGLRTTPGAPRASRRSPAAAPTAPRVPRGVAPTFVLDGRLAVTVALKGKHGAGLAMTLDEWQWGRVKVALGERWGVRVDKGHRYVVARGPRDGLRLARWIVGAKAGEVVSYVNGDSMDLRGSNLAVVDAREFVAGVFGWGGTGGTSYA